MSVYHSHVEINVPNVINNIHYFRSLIPQTTKLLVLVKAYAYGHGSGEFTKILEENGVDYLAVAFVGEGVKLRREGCKMPIIVLSASPQDYSTLLEYNLEPSIPSLENLKIFEKEVCKYIKANYIHDNRTFLCHVKIDTGMHRLGLMENEVKEFADYFCPKAQTDSKIKIASVFSHLATADDPSFDDFTLSQIELFKRLSGSIIERLPYTPMRHILNSAGIERFSNIAAFDMVRLGVGIYGVSPTKSPKVKSTAKLLTPVLQVKEIPQGDTIGYSRVGKATNGPMKIATISIGYADGIDRRFGQGKAKFCLNGHLVPTVGNICMDMCMLDITGINAKAGDMVTIFGDKPTIQDLSDLIDTIPYEILTSISHRIPRVYVNNPE